MTRPPRNLGVALRQHRLAAGLTQEELATGSGLSVRAIRDLERGRSARPHFRSVRMLAAALGLTGKQLSGLIGLVGAQSSSAGAEQLVRPGQLPAGVAQFVGRERELKALDQLLDEAGDQPPDGIVVILAIAGSAGIGKTALAVHWARRAAASFPDGQLYVNLRGFDPSNTPLAAGEAVSLFLAALGVATEHWPASLDARANLYRSVVAGKRLLIVLDNARDASQIRPLLPGSPGCLVLITGRTQLTGLTAAEGARILVLDVLADSEARELMAARLGTERMMADPQAVSDLVKSCAGLPLALAITSARAADRPRYPLAALAAELRDAEARLDALDAGDAVSSVRAAFSWSYDQLPAGGTRLFQLLGLHPGPDFTDHAAASLTAITPAKARRLLGELTSAHLLTQQAQDRFGCHDLLRTYAIEQAARTTSSAARRAAMERLLDYYLHTAAAADRLLYPLRRHVPLAAPGRGVTPGKLASHSQALAWLDIEHRGLLAAITLAAESGFDVHAWQLAFSLETFFYRRGHWQDWAATQHTALAAACRLGDRDAQAHANCGIANAQIYGGGQVAEALRYLAIALRLREEAGDLHGQARIHLYISPALLKQGRSHEALAASRRALRLAQSAGPHAEPVLADALNQVGWRLASLGRYSQALPYCQRAAALTRQLGNRHALPTSLDSLAYVHRHLGHHAVATDCYQQAVKLFGELGDRYSKALTLAHVGDAHHADGDTPAARRAWTQALTILEDLHHPEADRIRNKLTHPVAEPGACGG